MADRLTTGILLVGGRSSRFGSPKALARIGGETLAERGWRVLHEVCNEVLAVGKASDGLDLPFPLLDDGAGDRAPVFGLIAGLRNAAHELCLALPVDCPLVTAGLLRALAEAMAVPTTGPLPGAYERSLLPELERRVAEGELSLRGLNANVLEVDEAQLTNVNTRQDLIAAAIADWANGRDDVRGVVIVGSQARTDATADRWSDLDIVLIVDDPEPYATDGAWVEEFGSPALTSLGESPVREGIERRVLYGTGEDVDLWVIPAGALDRLGTVAAVLARGYRILADEVGIAERLRQVAASVTAPEQPTQRWLTELASDFWHDALWAAKKLRRGEVFVAKACIDGDLKTRIVTLLDWHARAVDPAVDTWHGGRFLERWADPGALAALESAYARYDLGDVARALWATIDLFQGLEYETASRLGLELEVDEADLRQRIAAVVPDPRGPSMR